MEPAKILMTMPFKKADPTQYTYMWASEIEKLAKDLGYRVKSIKEKYTTYDNVTTTLQKDEYDVYIHYGHGCATSLLGNTECVITRKYTTGQLIHMAESPYIEERQKLLKLLNPIGQISCPGICSLEDDTCSPICLRDTNVHLLSRKIAIAIACHSADQLGKCAVAYGAKVYVGYSDLMMFPVDSLGSDGFFKDVHREFIKELLLGNTIRGANIKMENLEDYLIRRYKRIKYLALPLLWNKKNRKIIGDLDATIYG